MSTRLTCAFMPEQSITAWPWLPVPDDGTAGGGGSDDKAGDAGSDAKTDHGDADEAADDDGDPEGADSLGDAGKKALDAMKAKWQAERTKRREAEAKLTEPKPDDKKADAPDVDAIRKEAEAAAKRKADERVIRSEVKAAATGKVAPDMLAHLHKFLDLTGFEVDDDGNVDEDEIADAIADAIQKWPSLAVQDGKRFKGTADGGTRKESTAPQLSEDDVKRLYSERKYDEIEKARVEGRLTGVLGAK